MTNPTKVIDNFAKMSRKFKIQIFKRYSFLCESNPLGTWVTECSWVRYQTVFLTENSQGTGYTYLCNIVTKSLYDDKEKNICICHFLFQIDETRTVRDKYITATNIISFFIETKRGLSGINI